MGTQSIRRIIADARLQEHSTGQLLSFFVGQLPQLRERLVLPETDAAPQLVHFVQRYIDYVPEFIDSARATSAELGVDAYVNPFLNMAEDFFLAPPEGLAGEGGLRDLLDEAFLAQRLIEEVNDRHLIYYQRPLLPLDMTRANVIVHHLIGDQPANRLDALVEHTVKRLVDREYLFDPGAELPEELSRAQWEKLPCLSRDAAIDLRLEPRTSH